ncbi:acyl-CoA thioesterase [Aliidiomarina maris]|uniref:Acyl-CoA thioester hydrolase n=1 Tax=Aliidiomarina maris TaxID=531312 RepID=A0A327X0I5_9GAMM|nr:thioesterase family protein [Aliidiomarina maris]RAJ99219.1 acyl-CoA thioester hydrolase [Aliidiomarina maris]RUO27636.1 thioesterase [Aliidiomarina maris]
MYVEELKVRFYETDALGHVNNTVIPAWFETGRLPVFELFNEQGNPYEISLIVANLNVDFVRPVYFGFAVTIKTYIARLGKSSFDIGSEVWQKGELCAKGTTILVNYDHKNERSVPVPDSIRAKLLQHSHPDHPLT